LRAFTVKSAEIADSAVEVVNLAVNGNVAQVDGTGCNGAFSHAAARAMDLIDLP
jgi:hypothetical protein